MKIKLNFCRTAFILQTVTLLLAGGCSKKESTSSSSSSTSSLTSGSLPVTEITQSIEGGYYTGSFAVPSDGVSFLLSVFKDNNGSTAFYSLSDPDGTDILSSSSTPTLSRTASGSLGAYGYANVLVPQSPSFSAKAGTWTFKAYSNDRVKLALRSGTTPTSTTIVVQPYITGTTWSAADLSDALSVMSSIYSANGITLSINSTITISDSQYTAVSGYFTDSTTSALVSQGSTEAVNLFFIEDYTGSWSNVLGNAAGIPGSMGIANAWNGVLNSLNAHASGSTLDAQLLGETAAHEMGHQLGLFHTTEKGGTEFDIITDTAECPKSSRDNDSDGKMSAEECEGYGAENVMFWTTWSSSSRSAGKKQETLSSHQQKVLKYSPIAK
ncbi:MAG: zinc-dependent metalloprotease family protein [SAR324 cluster bacterium]|nr:zinc-dependent metalloprotease family protein [SAR324 cluster bacterium]